MTVFYIVWPIVCAIGIPPLVWTATAWWRHRKLRSQYPNSGWLK